MKFWLVLLSLQFVGCAVTKDFPVTDQSNKLWQQRKNIMAAVESWDIRARAVFFDREEVYNLDIHWFQNKNDFEITLQAPFGQGTVKLESIEDRVIQKQVRLTMPDQKIYHRVSAEQLLRDILGWSIPVNGLKFWIRGIPHQQSSFEPEINFSGQLKTLNQDGWWINYLEYEQSNLASLPNYKIPSQIYLKNSEYALKLVIDQWTGKSLQNDTNELFPAF